MASKGSSGGKQTTENAPWKGVQPYLTQLYGAAAGDIFGNPQQFFPGQTYADPSQQTQQALGTTADFAQRNLAQANAYQPSPMFGQAASYYGDVLGGKYLNQAGNTENPYISGISQAIGDNVQQQVGSRFAGSGRAMGSPGEVQQFSRDVSNAMAPHLFQDATAKYGRDLQQQAMERGFQQQAAGMLPGLATTEAALQQQNQAQGYNALQALQGVGQFYDQQAQRPIDEAMARWDFGQSEPYQRLTRYGELLGMGSPYSSQSAQTSTAGAGLGSMIGSGLMGAGSGAMSGAMMGSMFPGIGNVAGGIGGGLLGGLGGFFSDRRLKHDIVRVGTGVRGLPLYRFKYLWSDQDFIGHMSDEVRAVAPWAVGKVGGFDFVRYSSL